MSGRAAVEPPQREKGQTSRSAPFPFCADVLSRPVLQSHDDGVVHLTAAERRLNVFDDGFLAVRVDGVRDLDVSLDRVHVRSTAAWLQGSAVPAALVLTGGAVAFEADTQACSLLQGQALLWLSM